MFCTNCGATLKDGVRFCNQCGAKVQVMTQSEPQIVFPSTSQAAPKDNASTAQQAAPQATQTAPYTAPQAAPNTAAQAAPYASTPTNAQSAQPAKPGISGRNIASMCGGLVAIIGFALPWINVNSALTGLSGAASNLSSALLGSSHASYAFDSTYSLFTMFSFGSGIDSYLSLVSKSSGYGMMFGVMTAAAVLMALLLVAGAVLIFTSRGRKTMLMRIGGGVCAALSIVIMIWLTAMSSASNFESSYYALSSLLSTNFLGCALSVIGGILAAALPQTMRPASARQASPQQPAQPAPPMAH